MIDCCFFLDSLTDLSLFYLFGLLLVSCILHFLSLLSYIHLHLTLPTYTIPFSPPNSSSFSVLLSIFTFLFCHTPPLPLHRSLRHLLLLPYILVFPRPLSHLIFTSLPLCLLLQPPPLPAHSLCREARHCRANPC